MRGSMRRKMLYLLYRNRKRALGIKNQANVENILVNYIKNELGILFIQYSNDLR